MSDEAEPQPETMFVVVPEPAAGPRRRAPRPIDEPRRTLRITIPTDLADDLKQAISVLPGCSLDELVEEALERILASHGAPPRAAARRSRIYESSILVILP